jgi:hypothetical protein
MAAINVGQLVATTLRRRLPKLYDNVTDNVALYHYLKRKTNMKYDSGRDILVPLEYAHPNIQWYQGYETLNIAPMDIVDAATFDWKQAAISVSISGEERLKNSGELGLVRLATAKVKNAEKGFVNGLGASVYSDGTGSGGKEIGGFRLLISSTPATGVVGGIDAAANTFWQNQFLDGSTFLGAAMDSTNIRRAMTRLWVLLTRNNEKPDAIFADNNLWEMYQNSLQAIQRITSEDASIKSGWITQRFMTADVILDGGQGGNCPTDTMFFVNTDYVQYVTHEEREMDIIGGQRMSINQDADVQLMFFAGNLTVSNRAMQGRLQQ